MERLELIGRFDQLTIKLTDLSQRIIELRGEVERCLAPELLTCQTCDAEEDSIADALKNGWTDIDYSEGPNWDYLGTCPDCLRELLDS